MFATDNKNTKQPFSINVIPLPCLRSLMQKVNGPNIDQNLQNYLNPPNLLQAEGPEGGGV